MRDATDTASPLIIPESAIDDSRPSLKHRRRWSYATPILEKSPSPNATYSTTTRRTRLGIWRILSVSSSSPPPSPIQQRAHSSRTSVALAQEESSTETLSPKRNESAAISTQAAEDTSDLKSTTGSEWFLLSAVEGTVSVASNGIPTSATSSEFVMVEPPSRAASPFPRYATTSKTTTRTLRPASSKRSLARSFSQPETQPRGRRTRPPSTLQLPPAFPQDASGHPILSPINLWPDSMSTRSSICESMMIPEPQQSLPFVSDRTERDDPVIRTCRIEYRPVIVLRRPQHRSVAATIVSIPEEASR